jgi:hypothetical protein
MSLAAFLAFMEANGAVIFAAWVVIEQVIAANPKWAANSTLQVITNTVRKFLGKYQKKA